MRGWHLDWRAPSAGEGVAVALLDSGVASHPDIPPIAALDYRIFAGSPGDVTGHGTAAAGIVAAIAPRARLIAARVVTDDLVADEHALAAAFAWAVGRGARVIALGVGRFRTWASPPDRAWSARTAAARAAGVLVIAPAGNGSRPGRPEAVRDPAACRHVVAVGAMDRDGRAHHANAVGDGVATVDLLAPGVGVYAPHPDGRTTEVTGSSAAAAVVAGRAAALLGGHPLWSVAELRAALVDGGGALERTPN